MKVSPASLLVRALGYLAAGALILAALFFGTAGTFDYWQAWVYLAVLFVPVIFALVYLMRRDPELLERRLRSRESQSSQRKVVGGGSLVILLAFVIPGLAQRFGWPTVPPAVSIVADVIVLVGYGLFFLVLRENSYAARTVTVETGQQVVTTGPYRFVRHPMYVGVLLMYLASPLGLGSAWAVVPALLLPFILVARIRDEERLLIEELPGYREYTTKTRFRLIPGVW